MNFFQRLWLVSALAFILGPAGLHAQTAQPAEAPQATPDQLVDALNRAFGAHDEFRALYAKGIVLQGVFTPSPTAASVSKAQHFQKTPTPITIRFSDFSGAPTVADADPMASPHGMAIKFYFPNDTEADIVAASYNGFPAATTDEFLAFINALAASSADAPKPTPLDKFKAAHPAAAAFMKEQNPPPVSFATETYFSVNSFKFTNAKGDVIFGRYQIRPVGGAQFLNKDEAAKADPNYLMKEIKQRVEKAPVEFKLLVQVAEKGDDIANASIAWPDTRKTIELGTIKIAKAMDDSIIAQRELVFLPTVMPDGIEPADPMIDTRAHAYVTSFSRRQQ
jgi:catalase